MGKELEILLQANRQGCVIVDKDVLLERDELVEPHGEGLYQEEAVLLFCLSRIWKDAPFGLA
jgi:hypothetical protein